MSCRVASSLPYVHMCTRLSPSDYMALGLMYGEHIFYIEPDLLSSQQHRSVENEKHEDNININIIP
jgi:hypothetical protein